MDSWLLLVCWTCCLKTSLSSMMVQSPETVRVSVGETFSLQCIHELPVQYCYSTTAWHKVHPRTGKLMEISERQQADKGGRDPRICPLNISNATLQHSGMYYCTGLYNTIVIVGNGSRVIVTDPALLDPSIIMYRPSDVSGPSVPLQCVVMGAVPSQVQVFWIVDQRRRTGWTESGWTENSDSALEFTRAHLTLSEEEWTEAEHVECVVEYDGKNISRSLAPRDNNLCNLLLYLGFGAAFLAVSVTVTVIVCLRKERQKDATAKGSRGRNTQGKRETLRPTTERHSNTDVEYSCLNPSSFNQRPNAAPQTELQ